jgi:hypothetical protein
LGLDLYKQTIILQRRNETKRYFSRNETKRNYIFFGTCSAETENRNEIIIFQKQNGTKRKKKKRFLTPALTIALSNSYRFTVINLFAEAYKFLI